MKVPTKKSIKSRLLWQFSLIILLAVVIVILVEWLSIDLLTARAFVVLMEKYGVKSPEVHQSFLDVAHAHLMWASLFALALGVGLGAWLTRRLLRPLAQMMVGTKRIAAGDYATRVPVVGQDELGQLAASFNRMADSLQSIEQMRKMMVVNIAHELRSPLTNMRGYLEALRDGVLPPSRENVALLHEETLRLVGLAEDLLQLSEADVARANLRPQQVDLAELLNKKLSLWQAQFAAKEIAVETQFERDACHLQADADKLAQVIHNLLQNAWQYTPSGGRVRISAARTPGQVAVSFVNTGADIDEKDLPFIFERFYRGEKSRSRHHGGVGIGLAIVKELIEAHGGRVLAESSPAETRISFTLPA